jgi:hypothetical protein
VGREGEKRGRTLRSATLREEYSFTLLILDQTVLVKQREKVQVESSNLRSLLELRRLHQLHLSSHSLTPLGTSYSTEIDC